MINCRQSYTVAKILITLSLTLGGSLAAPQNPELVKVLGNSHHWQSDTIAFYKGNDYTLAWFNNSQPSNALKVALEVLHTADKEGLDPADYKNADNAVKDFQNQKISVAEADSIISNEFIRYINHIRVGRIPPSDKARIIKLKSPKTEPIKLLAAALADSSNHYKKLREMAPPLPDYNKLRLVLAHYRALARQHSTLPAIKSDKLKVGVKSSDVVHLRQILSVIGSFKGDLTSEEFDSDLETALKEFQEIHTIGTDGVVGAATRKALNLSLAERINKIIVNMERLRWLPDEMGERHILVNVGGFEVLAVNNDHVDLRIKAIVGKPATKTPLFYAPLKNVIINPSWGVPSGIMARDKLPKIINDPSYVRRSGFTVTDSAGNKIDPDQADWEGNGMSYRLRQSPGANNALGRIKLNIENPYTIYLHGTPEEKLFKEPVRAYSSGCIRLQKPTDLAAWVLSSFSDWDVEKIETSIKAGGTKSIPLKDSIPVYFAYLTVWVDDNNVTHFSNDVYNMDDQLVKQLKLFHEVTYDAPEKAKRPRLG